MDTKLLRAVYENYRLQIMLNGVDHDGNLCFHSAYYYAVSERMFPYFHSHWCDEPDPFGEVYSIPKESIEEVVKYVDDLWIKKLVIPTFYDLESKFGKDRRVELIRIF
jgi:hypothetical protein